jgi:hypothetical protein
MASRLAGRNLGLHEELNVPDKLTDSPDAVASVAAPTKGEFDAVVTLVNELKADHNALIMALKN